MTQTQRVNYECRYCGSTNLIFDGACKWNITTQAHEFVDVYANPTTCLDCDNEGYPERVTVPDDAIIEQPYTVLLLRPEYVADEYGQDAYQAWVSASSVEEAATKGQEAAAEADSAPGNIPVDIEPDDYYVLSIHAGHLQDLKP